MNNVLLAATALFFVLGFAFTAGAIHEIIPSESQVPEPGPDAQKLNEYIIKYDPYRAWQLWPDKGRLYKGSQPHGALLTTFMNNAAYFSMKQGKGMADRSIIVKENYTADKKFVALSVMYKIRGYNPDGGDWFWAKYAPDGKVEASGKVRACIDCHAKQSGNDFIFTGTVK